MHSAEELKSLCPKHRQSAFAWRNHSYNPHRPSEWPGGPLMDSRTTHAERRADWKEKNEQQVSMIVGFCRNNQNCSEE